jgi:hypothetical protein
LWGDAGVSDTGRVANDVETEQVSGSHLIGCLCLTSTWLHHSHIDPREARSSCIGVCGPVGIRRSSRTSAGGRGLSAPTSRSVPPASTTPPCTAHANSRVFREVTRACMLWRQMRGSIPTFWSQDTSMITPKPPIVLSRWAHTNPFAHTHPHPCPPHVGISTEAAGSSARS